MPQLTITGISVPVRWQIHLQLLANMEKDVCWIVYPSKNIEHYKRWIAVLWK